nr:CheR family methyltransferase [uncultured Rhodopila sp.]
MPSKRRLAKTEGKLPPPPAAPAAIPEIVPEVPPQAPQPSEKPRLIVGVGASAGGISAFKSFFAKMPPDTGMAFVLVQHLDPDHESALVPIITGYTTMPVHLAEDGAAVESGNVYVIPPNVTLTIKDRHLHIKRPATTVARRVSVNTFLTSLAEDQGENAVGIILSGFGTDGATGIAAIKANGGLTLSQAEFDHHAQSGMPQSAASAGFVDHVLRVEDMPAALINYENHRTIFDNSRGPDGIRDDLPANLPAICTVLNARLGRDFGQYKDGTLLRRIQRRMHVLQTNNVPDYLDRLRSSPHEADLLFRELLIGVTRFFRDTEVFETLETTVIPELLAEHGSGEPIRVWVPGCATGEEAYSIAILFKEQRDKLSDAGPIQIFATDIDAHAIDAARVGVYSETIASDMPEARLQQNFVKEEGGYRISKFIREMCLFSVHDLVKDPPFSKLDLISCRNLLIYFQPQLQHRVLTTFHYALLPNRYLLLGPSEGVSVQPRLFAPLNKKQRLFTRQSVAARLPVYPLAHLPLAAPLGKRLVIQGHDAIERRAVQAVNRYLPAYLVVDRHYDVLRFAGQTAKYIEPATGAASLNLFNLLHPDLRSVVRSAIGQAAETGERVLHGSVLVAAGDRNEAVNLIVEPLTETDGDTLFVIAFQEVVPPDPGSVVAIVREADERNGSATRSLKRDLAATRERLRNVTEELQSSNEELQSSNEEYLSVNEELQSTNEELETSKEELQSLNEELQTINAELNHRNEGLVRAHSDLANLFDSTSIATLFLDHDLRIRRFTPRLLEIFKVREGDEGRPITDIVTRLTRDWLGEDVRKVLTNLVFIEREVSLADGGLSYLMQVRPYRDMNNLIDGVVITFVDISEHKRHEEARARLAAIVEWSHDAIISHDMDGIITSWNAGAAKLFGYAAAEAIGQPIGDVLKGPQPRNWASLIKSLDESEPAADFDSVKTTRNGGTVEVSITVSPLRDSDGKVVGGSVVARDISERRAAEQKAALLLSELDHRVKNILAIVSAIVTQTLRTSESPEAFAEEIQGRIGAIAKAHGLLTQSGHGELLLQALILTELAPYERGAGNIEVGGSAVSLTPKAGLALAMAIHELASNAAKYGSLSNGSGSLSVTWAVEQRPHGPVLALNWSETGGPVVRPPTRRGFGSTLIERGLAHELDAEVTQAFLPEGLRCTIAIPMTTEIDLVHIEGQK